MTSDRPHPSQQRTWFALGLVGAVGLAALVVYLALTPRQGALARPLAQNEAQADEVAQQRDPVKPPDLDGGVAWLNTDKPLKLKDLKGKIVLLDFWTLCCINCIHVLPDLAKLEKKYEKEIVVIGVHSAKFENEKETESIRKAILRYEIAHPVVNDADMKIWNAYDVSSWPTLAVIDPEGNFVGRVSGEGNFDILDRAIAKLIKVHKDKKTLNEKPMTFALERDRQGPLFFPGKVLADEKGKRIFIADSTHHRVVVTDMNGKKLDIAGAGVSGKQDGGFDSATFNDPQGMAVKGDTLYVADRKNHLIRALDLKNRTVKTVAGIGRQGDDRSSGGPALDVGLNSPWDLLLHGNDQLFIAMAGHHQIWVMDLTKNELARYAGNGRENIRDGSLVRCELAQPSGLASDGKNLYVADSEVSAIRSVPLDNMGNVKTLVGKGLFDFGDVDGVGDAVRLQHALGVAFHEGKLYVADTYNSKLKVLDPEKRTCTTFIPNSSGWFTGPTFHEPAGLSYANGKLYVADTNAHRIRVVDLKTKAVTTLPLSGVEAPKPKS